MDSDVTLKSLAQKEWYVMGFGGGEFRCCY